MTTKRTIRGKPLSREDIVLYCDQLKEYADTLKLPGAKANLLNHVNGFMRDLKNEEAAKEGLQMTEVNIHRLKTMKGILDNTLKAEIKIQQNFKDQLKAEEDESERWIVEG